AVVVHSTFAGGFFRPQASRWTAASGMVGLGFLSGGDVSEANGVNADGTVVVGEASGRVGTFAFRWTATSGMRVLVFPGSSTATGVNADGTVVVGEFNGQAFRWVNGTLTGLGFLPGSNSRSRPP